MTSQTRRMNTNIAQKVEKLVEADLKLPGFCKPSIGNSYSISRRYRVMYVFSGTRIHQEYPACKHVVLSPEAFYNGSYGYMDHSYDLAIDVNAIEYQVSLDRLLSNISDTLSTDDIVIHRFFPRPISQLTEEEFSELDEKIAVDLFKKLLAICAPTHIIFKNDKTLKRINEAFTSLEGLSIKDFLEDNYIRYVIGDEALATVSRADYYVEKLMSDRAFAESALDDAFLQECLYWDDAKIRYFDVPAANELKKDPDVVRRILLSLANTANKPELYNKLLRPFMVPKYSRYLYCMPRAWKILGIDKTEWEKTCASFAGSNDELFKQTVASLNQSSDIRGLTKIRLLSMKLQEAYAMSDGETIGLLIEELARETDRMQASRRIAATMPVSDKQRKARANNAAKARKAKNDKLHKVRLEEEKRSAEFKERLARPKLNQVKMKSERSPQQKAALEKARQSNPKVNPSLKSGQK